MSIPRRDIPWLLVAVAACTPACAGTPPPRVATTVETRPQPAGSLRAELHGALSPEGPVGFSLGDSAWTAVLEVIPERGGFVLFPEVGDGDRHLLPAGEHVVGPAPEHRPGLRDACRIDPPVRYRLLVAAGAPLRLDRLRLRRVPGETWWRVEAVHPRTPTESAVEQLRMLVQPASGELASDLTAFPHRCEEVSPPTPPVRPPSSADHVAPPRSLIPSRSRA